MKIGILGFGYMGTIRARVLRGRADCDVARTFHTDDSVPGRSARWQDVVDDPTLDVVFVCLPNALTCEATCRALAAGKHVFAEKPPGVSVGEVLRMIEAERASGKTLQFGFNLRFHPAVRRARALVSEGELGTLAWLRGVYGKPMAPGFGSDWRADPAVAGGGILLDQGVHMLDVFRMLVGDFEDVRAFAATDPSRRVEDDVMAILRTARGQLASLHSSHSQSPPRFSLDIGMTRGAIRLEGLLTRTGRYGPERIGWGPLDAPNAHEETFVEDRSWDDEVEAFLSAVRSGSKPSEGSTADALALMMLVERIHAEAGLARGPR